jgi:hypothetical protein
MPSSNPLTQWRDWWRGLSTVDRIAIPIIAVIAVAVFVAVLLAPL